MTTWWSETGAIISENGGLASGEGARDQYLQQNLSPEYNSDKEFQNCPFIVSVSLSRSAERRPADPDKIKMTLETSR